MVKMVTRFADDEMFSTHNYSHHHVCLCMHVRLKSIMIKKKLNLKLIELEIVDQIHLTQKNLL